MIPSSVLFLPRFDNKRQIASSEITIVQKLMKTDGKGKPTKIRRFMFNVMISGPSKQRDCIYSLASSS